MHLVHLGLDTRLELLKSLTGEYASRNQFVGKGDDGISSPRLVPILFRPVVFDIPVVMTP